MSVQEPAVQYHVAGKPPVAQQYPGEKFSQGRGLGTA